MTSSFSFSYEEPGQVGRRIADIGLNIKNWSKKCHVPGLVRFVEAPAEAEEEKKEDENKEKTEKSVESPAEGTENQAKNPRQGRKRFEYSHQVYLVLEEYKEKFPEAL